VERRRRTSSTKAMPGFGLSYTNVTYPVLAGQDNSFPGSPASCCTACGAPNSFAAMLCALSLSTRFLPHVGGVRASTPVDAGHGGSGSMGRCMTRVRLASASGSGRSSISGEQLWLPAKESTASGLQNVSVCLLCIFRFRFKMSRFLSTEWSVRACVCVCVCACMRACVRACVRTLLTNTEQARARAQVHLVCVRARSVHACMDRTARCLRRSSRSTEHPSQV